MSDKVSHAFSAFTIALALICFGQALMVRDWAIVASCFVIITSQLQVVLLRRRLSGKHA